MSQTSKLQPIAENLWTVPGSAKLMPGVHLPTSATVIRQDDGGILIYSPNSALDAEVAAEIGALGEVTTLLSPNLFHHLFLQRAQELFPNAQTLGGEGLQAKNKGLRIDQTYGATVPEVLSKNFEVVRIEGAPRFDEVVLLHRRSKTLIVADYFFNVHETKGFLTPTILRMTGSYKRSTQSKLWRKMTKDREAMKASANAVLALDYKRVVMSHGTPVEDGCDFTRQSLSWLVGEPN